MIMKLLKLSLIAVLLAIGFEGFSQQPLSPYQVTNLKQKKTFTRNTQRDSIKVPVVDYALKQAYWAYPVDLQLYKTWVGSISQTGTSAPTATVMYNQLGTITWARDSVGSYSGKIAQSVATSPFTTNKTFALVTPGWPGYSVPQNWAPRVSFRRLTDSTFQVRITRNDSLIDAQASNVMLELRVYK